MTGTQVAAQVFWALRDWLKRAGDASPDIGYTGRNAKFGNGPIMKYPLFRMVIAAVLCWSGAAPAQNDLPANVDLQFRFVNPGARAQAMGGAFVGLADDATAIFSNPAGLAQLRSASVVAELNFVERDHEIPFFGGRIEQTGLQDFRFDLESRDFPEETHSVPFIAYVRPGAKLKWGVFYAEQARFERVFQTEGLSLPDYDGERFVAGNILEFFFPSRNRIEVAMRSLGASLAGKLGPRLAWGVTLAYNDFTYAGGSTLIFPDPRELFPDVTFNPRQIAELEPFFGTAVADVTVDGDDQAPGVFGGLMFWPTDRFGLGVVYKFQPSFDYDYRLEGLDANFEPVPVETGTAEFRVPDSFGVGFSFKPTETFVLSVEVDRVRYSELRDGFRAFFANPNDPSEASQTVDDVTEYHVGAEWFLANLRYPLALRVGYWHEPYHALQNTNLDTQLLFRYLNDLDFFEQDVRQTVFLQRFAEDENHLTFGLGLTFGRAFTLDAAVDAAGESTSYTLSGVFRL